MPINYLMTMRLLFPSIKYSSSGGACIGAIVVSLALLLPSTMARSEPEQLIAGESDGITSMPESGNPQDADLAYGAFQRGQYLTAFKLALPRATMGDPAAQLLIAEIYQKGLGIKRDTKEAAQWYKIAADSGSTEGQFSYGLKLLEGKDVAQDRKAAKIYLQKAADAGHPVAQFNYGQMVAHDRPTTRGYQIAYEYFKKAAQGGVGDAWFALAQLEIKGIGSIPGDEYQAREYLAKAAKAGLINAQIEYGIWLANGRGGPQDLKQSLVWLRKAAKRGNAIAQNRVAHILARGIGVKKDPFEAAKWYLLSRRAGHKDDVLDKFFDSLSPKDQQAALKAANAYRPRLFK